MDGPRHAFEQAQSMSAPAVRSEAAKRYQKAGNSSQSGSESVEKLIRVSLSKFWAISSRASAGYSDLP
jgi:hypothetical protein